MTDPENKTHSDDIPILQPLLLTHFVCEKTSSSEK